MHLIAAFDLGRLVVFSRSDRAGLALVYVCSILGLADLWSSGGRRRLLGVEADLIGPTELAGAREEDGVHINALAPGWFPSEVPTELFIDDSLARWLVRNAMLRRGG